MKKTISLSLLATFASASVMAQDAPSLIKNGGFDPGQPGWTLTAGATFEKDEARGNTLVLRCAPDTNVKCSQELAVDPEWGVLRFSCWVDVPSITPGTAATYHDARLVVTGSRADNSLWHATAGYWRMPTPGWIRSVETLAIPEGVVKVQIAPVIYSAQGEMRMADLKVEMVAKRGEVYTPPEVVAVASGPVPDLPEIKNGGFDPALPGWQLRPGAAFEKDADRGNVLVLRCEPDTNAMILQDLALNPEWGMLKFTYWVNVPSITPGAESFHDARLVVTGSRADNTIWHATAGFWKRPTAGWVKTEQNLLIPRDVVKLTLAPSIYRSQGEMRMTDLRVELAMRRGEAMDSTANITPDWGKEPVEPQGPMRGVVCLNGMWRFMPAAGPASEKPTEQGWGWQRVPGMWAPGPLNDGAGEAWAEFSAGSPAGWYGRDLAIPAQWKGRAILLDLWRVSTDAIVFVDGKEAGRASWPGGEVDITPFVTPGDTHALWVKVIAVASTEQFTRYMGMAPGQIFTEQPRLQSRGLIGDVFLASRPKGARITDCFVKTSVRENKLSLEVSYAGLAKAGRVSLAATIKNPDGSVAKTFSQNVNATAGDGVLHAAWKWNDPILWDLDTPHLYTLELAAKGEGLDDVKAETFGFREFRVEGRDCLLNEKRISLRFYPIHGQLIGLSEGTRFAYQGLKKAGFNGIEPEPWNRGARGTQQFDHIYYEQADKEGFLVLAPMIEMNYLVYKWAEPGVADEWENEMRAEVRRHRNHPSVIGWVTGFNRFGHNGDQNPMNIGRNMDPQNPKYLEGVPVGRDALARIRAFDPTRIAIAHAGAAVGDLYTANNYLNLTALQEREEWPSAWAQTGDMPVLMVEFGTPVFCSFHRNKYGYNGSIVSEPLYTEYLATYYGAESYAMETPEYRDMLSRTYQGGRNWASWHALSSTEVLLHVPAFVNLAELFNRNTWRAWRTFGVTGMIPWCAANGWIRNNPDANQQPIVPTPWEPGRRGWWRGAVSDNLVRFLSPSARNIAGDALIANNSETLAWIAGSANPAHGENDPGAIADKTHNFRPGDTVKKQAALINETRHAAPWQLRWSATLDGKEIASGNAQGNLKAGEILLRPFEFKLPASNAARVEGKITLAATVAGVNHADAFDFCVFNVAKPALPAIAVLDPAAETTAMLKTLGANVTEWKPGEKPALLVIGRRALEKTPPETMREAEAFIRGGGRAILMAQDPEWMRQRLGLRVARHLSRRVFPSFDSPLFNAADLVNWNGVSRLVSENDLPRTDGWGECPPYGWRWGARHAITSAAIEVPHNAGWTPLLRCEFDGAYTPLAEINVGNGLLMICMLDLEDHAAADPVAERLGRGILDWVATKAKPAPRVATTYIGDDNGAAFVKSLGIEHTVAKALPQNGLVILGDNAGISDADLNAFMQRGGKLLVLATRSEKGVLGVACRREEKFAGSINVPAWPEALGLWPGELRFRADTPAWLIVSGADEIAADGLLAKKGNAIFCQLDPASLDDQKTAWHHYTKWRQARGVAQLAANLGASFAFDPMILHAGAHNQIQLAGDGWKAALAGQFPLVKDLAQRPPDPGIRENTAEMVKPGFDDSAWLSVRAPGAFQGYGPEWNVNGEVVFRKTVNIPDAWANRDLRVSLSLVDDFDDTYFDGVRVGGVTGDPNAWNTSRVYTIPAEHVKPGPRVLAVRVWDWYGNGGFTGNAGAMFIEPVDAIRPPAYQPGWSNDQIWGDDPYRYYRW